LSLIVRMDDAIMAVYDFLVFDFEYNPEQKIFVRFLVRERIGDHFGPFFFATREHVISAMKNGLVFEMDPSISRKECVNNVQLHLITIDGCHYIRKDQQEIEGDE
jgi:hypothetical protein